MMAFSFEDLLTGKPLLDPNYVKFFATVWSVVEGVQDFKEIPMNDCTEEDYALFWPLDESEQKRLDNLKKNNALKCIDWADETVEIWGKESSGNYGAVDIMVLPCAVMETEIGGKEDRIPKNCNRDKEKLAEYLGSG